MEEYRLPPATHVGFANLRVANLERSLTFYRDIAGLKEHRPAFGLSGPDRGRSVSLSPMGLGPAILILTEDPEARPKPARTTGLYHIAIRYPDRASLGQALQRMLAQGWTLGGASDHGVSEALYTSDPDGNGVELYVDRPREKWPREQGRVGMVTAPLDVQSLYQEGLETSSTGDGAPAGVVMGHIHLQVSDLQRSGSFYQDRIGLDITQDSYPGALFLSAGGYHHHIGLNTWASRGAPPPPPDSAGLASFSFVLPDRESLAQLVDHLEAAGISPEKHALPEGVSLTRFWTRTATGWIWSAS